MKVRGTPSTSAAVSTFVVAAFLLAALVAVIGSAQAAPQKKVFNAVVDVQNVSTLTPTSARLRLTLSNDASSNQTLGSANFVAPPGVTIDDGALTTSRTGWTATKNGNVVEFRSTSNALPPSTSSTPSSVFADVNVSNLDALACTDATWTVFAKQSNDFSGAGNDFTAGAATNRRPLGSLDIAQIETIVPAPPDPDLHVPQIVTNENKDVLVTARDICGDLYTNYGTSVGRATVFVAGPSSVPPRLDGAGSLALSGSGATLKTTLKPIVVETGDLLTVTDSLSTTGQSIGDTSNSFDVVTELCTSLDLTCELNNGRVRVFGDGPPPKEEENDPDPSLGFGFSSTLTVDCLGERTAAEGLGGYAVNINPRDYPTNDPITVTVIYKKNDLPNGPVTNIAFCLSKTNGDTWDTPLAECAQTPVAPCVKRTKTQGGDLSAAFYIRPTDPWGTGR